MEMSAAIASLAALAQDTRLGIFRLLVQEGPQGLPAGQIGERLAVAPATLSFHLQQLRQAGLVTSWRDGKSIVYAANFTTMNELLAYLTENCCRGAPETCGVAACPACAGDAA